MANNYCQFSVGINLTTDKLKLAKDAAEKYRAQGVEDDEEFDPRDGFEHQFYDGNNPSKKTKGYFRADAGRAGLWVCRENGRWESGLS